VNPKTRKYVMQILRLIAIIPMMAFIVLPFLILISSSLKMEGEINSLNPTLIPNHIIFDNFIELFKNKSFVLSIKNSALISSLTMVLTLFVSFPAAYIIAREKGKAIPVLQIWTLLSQMIPVITLTVPLYLILGSLKLTDSFPGLALVYITWQIPTTLWLLKVYISSFPTELEDAARIDGCNTWKMFIKIMLPIILPGVLTAGIFSLIGAWNEFFFALVFMKSPENILVSTKLWAFIGISGQSRDNMLAAASLLSCIPGIILFSVFQKYYVSGLTEGAVK